MTDFVKKTKLTELENKIPEVSSSATETALTAVENKIPSNLVKKTDYDRKITEIEKFENLLKIENLLITIMASILLLQSLIL